MPQSQPPGVRVFKMGGLGDLRRCDLAHLPDLGTYAAVIHKDKPLLVKIVKLDPNTRQFLATVATLTGYSEQFALAGVGDLLLAFGVDGEILEIDPEAKTVVLIVDTNLTFYCAAGPLDP